jgi:hypothetical protein
MKVFFENGETAAVTKAEAHGVSDDRKEKESDMRPCETTLVMIGPHGSGKTTLGRLAAGFLGWVFDAEIGNVLRQKALQEDIANNAARVQPEFDRAVMEMEIERDLRAAGCRVVETWHPGNMGYARMRSPEVAIQYDAVLRDHIARLGHRVLVQPLTIERPTALKRLTQPGPDEKTMADFFMGVGRKALEDAVAWGLELLPIVRTDRMSIEDACREVLQNLNTNHAISLTGCVKP